MTARDSEDKELLRNQFRSERRDLEASARRAASRSVCERLAGWECARRCSNVAGYLSFDGEVDVEAYLEGRLEGPGSVALPRVVDEESMEYVEVGSLDEVEEGSFGIREPVGEACDLEELELFLVPGVGFDREGGRIGMGWGYYDRALGRRRAGGGGTRARFVGICYEFQLVAAGLPTEEHDVRMDAIVTPEEIVRCSSRADSA